MITISYKNPYLLLILINDALFVLFGGKNYRNVTFELKYTVSSFFIEKKLDT